MLWSYVITGRHGTEWNGLVEATGGGAAVKQALADAFGDQFRDGEANDPHTRLVGWFGGTEDADDQLGRIDADATSHQIFNGDHCYDVTVEEHQAEGPAKVKLSFEVTLDANDMRLLSEAARKGDFVDVASDLYLDKEHEQHLQQQFRDKVAQLLKARGVKIKGEEAHVGQPE